jgi:hypothetical protein
MSVKTRIHDGLGTSRTVAVTPSNALLVQVLPETSKGVPPADLSNLKLLQEFLVDSTGSSDQRVNGSVTPVEFSVTASASRTKWITGFRIIIEGDGFELASADFRDYGAVGSPGLTNGIEIEAFQGGVTTSIAAEPIRNAGDYLNYADDFTNFVNAVSSQSDYLMFMFEFATPVVLTEGSTDRLTIRIRDNLITAITSTATPRQYAIARGYQEAL